MTRALLAAGIDLSFLAYFIVSGRPKRAYPLDWDSAWARCPSNPDRVR
jgi:hypothetical protein